MLYKGNKREQLNKKRTVIHHFCTYCDNIIIMSLFSHINQVMKIWYRDSPSYHSTRSSNRNTIP